MSKQPRSTADDEQLDDYAENSEEEEEEPVIEKEDVKRIETINNYDQFHRLILENFYAVQEAEKTEILVPLFAHEDGSVDIGIVEVEEEDLENLSTVWDEKIN